MSQQKNDLNQHYFKREFWKGNSERGQDQKKYWNKLE